MNALFDTFLAIFVIGLLINIGTLGTLLVVSVMERRRPVLPRAVVHVA